MSNRLPILAATAATLHREARSLEDAASAKALDLGAALAEAKALCEHGAWGPWLAGTGIAERSAQRYLALHRVALKPATVAALGGVAAAATWASGARLPAPGFCLLAETSGDDADSPPLAVVWPASPGHHVALIDLGREAFIETTRRPLLAEQGVWATCWQLLGERTAEARFTTVPDRPGVPATLAGLDAMGGRA